MRNIRQVEMGERMKEMVQLAISQAWEYAKTFELAPINTKLDKEEFLAFYRIMNRVGKYASERYFNDFVTVGFFKLHDKDTTFTVNHIKNYQGVRVPTKEEWENPIKKEETQK